MERSFLTKNERLSLKKEIDYLFANGHAFISFPLRIIYCMHACTTTESGISILISVPKKRIKGAVSRNRIKRLVRESYRLNKNETLAKCNLNGQQLHIAYIYICNEQKSYFEMEKAIRKAFEIICKKLQAT